MNEKLKKILIIVTITIFSLGLLYFYIYPFIYGMIKPSASYYDSLRDNCPTFIDSFGNMNCCNSTITEMEKNNLKAPGILGCPFGYYWIAAQCQGSQSFCYKPEKKEKIDNVDDCLKLSENNEDNNIIGKPVAYSNVKSNNDEINSETQKVDSCIFKLVDEDEDIIDDEICENIQSSYYKYLCFQRIAMHKKDISLCNLDYLGKQSNVDGCIINMALYYQNKTLCSKSSEPSICYSKYTYEFEDGPKPKSRLSFN